MLSLITCYLQGSSIFCGEHPSVVESPFSVRILPVVGMEFKDDGNAVPYSFYYPYDYGYYYPDTYGFTKSTIPDRECYMRFEDGTIFYECD
ncbi:hypothetical protein Cs308_0646 [Candidatus Chlamydia sanziniae]|uniref:Uncharacterized protein n=1 Tax=Candidatus Chlamydia sanziniae TaxID=1806891 RepID=A0A1A9HY16_9CHLA|nr:hypothetical protein Cs308_0646 [Candidatus Chlamydia sanziniae]